MQSKARDIHGKSEIARENGDFLESLKLNDEALLLYQKEHDLAGITEVLAARFNAYKHLFRKTNDRSYLVIGKHLLEASLEIAEASNDPKNLTAPLYNLAKAYEEMDELKKAQQYYQKAVENITTTPSKTYDRPAIIADFKIHYENINYILGDKSARARLEEALHELEQTHEDIFTKNVWVSGGYINLAEILRIDDPQTAVTYLNKAKEIIDSDERLVLRKSQWEKLARSFN